MFDDGAPKVLDIHELTDGSRLMSPRRQPTYTLRVNQWVRVDDEPWRIADLRQSHGGGRIVHLEGHPPLSLAPGDCLPVYAVTPPPVRIAAVRR